MIRMIMTTMSLVVSDEAAAARGERFSDSSGPWKAAGALIKGIQFNGPRRADAHSQK